jgi:hypothetical protein
MDAANPVKSLITPPPNAQKESPLSNLFLIAKLIIFSNEVKFLFCSPEGRVKTKILKLSFDRFFLT